MIILVIITIVLVLILFRPPETFTSTVPVYVVSFAYNCCQKAQDNLEKTALKYGATKVFNLNLETLDAPYDVKKFIISNKRGAGYWIWKPYALKQVLGYSSPGDIIIYVDSSTYFEKSMKSILSFIEEYSILSFKHGTSHTNQSIWTKMDAVEYFGYSLNEWCETHGQRDQFIASFVGIKNDNVGNFFVNTWVDSLTPDNANLFDDTLSALPNCPDFKESRHDQQMLSLLLYKYFGDIPFPDYSEKYGFIRHKPINGQNRHL